jgi:replicative DNA helicase
MNDLAINENTQSKQIGKHTIPINAKVYPHDESLEYQVIGQLLAAGDNGQGLETFRSCKSYLEADDFFMQKLEWIYNAISQIVAAGQDYDTQAVIAQLRQTQGARMNALEYVGGEFELLDIANTHTHNLETHSKQVVILSLRRKIAGCAQIQSELALKDNNLSEQLEELSAWVSALRLRNQILSEDTTRDFAQGLAGQSAKLRAGQVEASTKIWISELQEYLHGWKARKLYIIAAGISMGKSAWLLSAAIEAAKQGKKVVFFTFEMTMDELINRALAIICNINGQRIQNNTLRPADIERMNHNLDRARSWLKPENFHIEVMNTPNMNDVRAKLDMHSIANQCDICFIDYVGIEVMSFIKSNARQREPGPTEFANHLWKEMRQIKSEYAIPFIVGAQVNRAYQDRDSKRPYATDIANSSKAENAADVVMLLHRMHRVDALSPPNHADIDLAKNRNGATTGEQLINLHFDSGTTYFSGWEVEA